MRPAGLIGSTIGGYTVETLLGSGGMASVYRGLDLQLQRPVAIKVLSSHAAALPGFADRFRQEARLVASLRHPNIVQIYAFGEERGLTYMVQELLPGPTLEQRLADVTRQGSRLTPGEVTSVVAQLAAALDGAHTAGIIHRDVKPANALWNGAGALVLTDFGIAKDLGGAVAQTQTGIVMGTPTYMSPEQAQGLPLTPATDIYALGVILYELLTGQVPFAGPQAMPVLLKHVQEPPPPPRELRPDLPPAVEAVVLRALAKAPAARYASAGALAEALRQAWSIPAGTSDIHQASTQIWRSPAPASTGTPPARPAMATPLAGAPAQPTPSLAAPRRVSLLPVLGGLLLLAFIGGMLLALRGNSGAADEGTSATVVAEAPPTPIAEVRSLLTAGVQDGSAGPQGEALVAALDAAGQALEQDDSAGAAARLADLQRILIQEARAGSLEPDLLRRALTGIDTIADDHGLILPLRVGAG